jgi:DNA modification methylase
VVTDPPYGLGKIPSVEEIIHYLRGERLETGDFMGKDWDIPSVTIWKECFRVLKPGGHLLSFGGTRTWDLISLGLRAAGFQLRDTIAEDNPGLQWRHSQGFPKSLNIGKAIDKLKGVKREVTGQREGGFGNKPGNEGGGDEDSSLWVNKAPTTKEIRENASSIVPLTVPATPEAAQWEGWGTALKPSWEPILVFRKPVSGDTVAENVLEHGTGAINIDACRVAGQAQVPASIRSYRRFDDKGDEPELVDAPAAHPGGRWPSNVVMVHSEGCRKVGTKKVKGSQLNQVIERSKSKSPTYSGGKSQTDGYSHGYTDESGQETVEAWECAPGCPVRALDEQSGERPSSGLGPNQSRGSTTPNVYGGGWTAQGQLYDDSGGASRFFPQFEADQELTPKPSWEPIMVFRKPVEGTVAENVLEHGTGGINIEGTRVRHASPEDFEKHKAMVDRLKEQGGSLGDSWKNSSDLSGASEVRTSGRWPSNVVMVHSEGCKKVGTRPVRGDNRGHPGGVRPSGFVDVGADKGDSKPNASVYGDTEVDAWECVPGCPVKSLDEQSGVLKSAMGNTSLQKENEATVNFNGRAFSTPGVNQHGDSGGASRFFPQFEGQTPPEAPFLYTGKATKREATLDGQVLNTHPTKKPLSLMTWLVRLVTPKKGICLDPFAGSGTTCVASIEEGMRFIGIERDPEYHAMAQARVGLVFQKDQEDQDLRDGFDELMNG